MWEELAKYKNNFLQLEVQHLSAQRLNAIQSKELSEIVYGKRFTKCRLLEQERRECKSAGYFENRAQLSYGFQALPKLMKEMGSDDREVQWKALTSLSEYIVNHLHAQRAINEEELVRKAENFFLRLRYSYQQEYHREIETLLRLFYNIAMHMNGGKQMLHRRRLIDQLYKMIQYREEYMEQAANILRLITKDADDVYFLLKHYMAMSRLAKIYGQDVCVHSYPISLWHHLMALIELAPDEAIEKGFFEILYTRIKGRLYNFHIYDLRCFALLLRCEEGHNRFLDIDGVKVLYEIFKEREIKPLDTYENVVLTLMHGIVSKRILWRCCSFLQLTQIITSLAKGDGNDVDTIKSNMQLWSLQTLRQLGTMPSIKRYMQENCLEELKTIQSASESNKRQLDELLYWLQREVYHTSNLYIYEKSKLPMDDS